MMYCPKCATPLADDQKFCRSCGIDLQVVAQILNDEYEEESVDSEERSPRDRVSLLGLVLLFSGLMIGCLIPISLGFFKGWPYLNQLILILAGLAGLPFFGGITLLVYSDYLPETRAVKQKRAGNLLKGVTTNQLLSPPGSEPVDFNERSTDLLKTPVGKESG